MLQNLKFVREMSISFKRKNTSSNIHSSTSSESLIIYKHVNIRKKSSQEVDEVKKYVEGPRKLSEDSKDSKKSSDDDMDSSSSNKSVEHKVKQRQLNLNNGKILKLKTLYQKLHIRNSMSP